MKKFFVSLFAVVFAFGFMSCQKLTDFYSGTYLTLELPRNSSRAIGTIEYSEITSYLIQIENASGQIVHSKNYKAGKKNPTITGLDTGKINIYIYAYKGAEGSADIVGSGSETTVLKVGSNKAYVTVYTTNEIMPLMGSLGSISNPCSNIQELQQFIDAVSVVEGGVVSKKTYAVFATSKSLLGNLEILGGRNIGIHFVKDASDASQESIQMNGTITINDNSTVKFEGDMGDDAFPCISTQPDGYSVIYVKNGNVEFIDIGFMNLNVYQGSVTLNNVNRGNVTFLSLGDDVEENFIPSLTLNGQNNASVVLQNTELNICINDNVKEGYYASDGIFGKTSGIDIILQNDDLSEVFASAQNGQVIEPYLIKTTNRKTTESSIDINDYVYVSTKEGEYITADFFINEEGKVVKRIQNIYDLPSNPKGTYYVSTVNNTDPFSYVENSIAISENLVVKGQKICRTEESSQGSDFEITKTYINMKSNGGSSQIQVLKGGSLTFENLEMDTSDSYKTDGAINVAAGGNLYFKNTCWELNERSNPLIHNSGNIELFDSQIKLTASWVPYLIIDVPVANSTDPKILLDGSSFVTKMSVYGGQITLGSDFKYDENVSDDKINIYGDIDDKYENQSFIINNSKLPTISNIFDFRNGLDQKLPYVLTLKGYLFNTANSIKTMKSLIDAIQNETSENEFFISASFDSSVVGSYYSIPIKRNIIITGLTEYSADGSSSPKNPTLNKANLLGNGNDYLFTISNSATLKLNNLNLCNTNSNGDGINTSNSSLINVTTSGSLICKNCTFADNDINSSVSGIPGLVLVSGTAKFENCTFSNAPNEEIISTNAPLIKVFSNGNANFTNCNLYGNNNTSSSGNIILNEGITTIKDSVVCNMITEDNKYLIPNSETNNFYDSSNNALVAKTALLYASPTGKFYIDNSYLAGNIVSASGDLYPRDEDGSVIQLCFDTESSPRRTGYAELKNVNIVGCKTSNETISTNMLVRVNGYDAQYETSNIPRTGLVIDGITIDNCQGLSIYSVGNVYLKGDLEIPSGNAIFMYNNTNTTGGGYYYFPKLFKYGNLKFNGDDKITIKYCNYNAKVRYTDPIDIKYDNLFAKQRSPELEPVTFEENCEPTEEDIKHFYMNGIYMNGINSYIYMDSKGYLGYDFWYYADCDNQGKSYSFGTEIGAYQYQNSMVENKEFTVNRTLIPACERLISLAKDRSDDAQNPVVSFSANPGFEVSKRYGDYALNVAYNETYNGLTFFGDNNQLTFKSTGSTDSYLVKVVNGSTVIAEEINLVSSSEDGQLVKITDYANFVLKNGAYVSYSDFNYNDADQRAHITMEKGDLYLESAKIKDGYLLVDLTDTDYTITISGTTLSDGGKIILNVDPSILDENHSIPLKITGFNDQYVIFKCSGFTNYTYDDNKTIVTFME